MSKTESLEKRLIEKGYKLTKNRRFLFQALMQSPDKWTSAQQLYEAVAKKNPSVNFSTIYRNLDTLTEIDALCKISKNDGINYYAINLQDKPHHHHLICKSCGCVIPLPFCPLNNLEGEDLNHFSELECKFEVYGYCPLCQTENQYKS